MKTEKKYSKPFNRKIHLPSGEWSYRIARGWLWVRSPDGNATFKMSFETFTGLSRHDDLKVTIRPQDIKDFIDNGFEPVEYDEGQYNHFRPESSAYGWYDDKDEEDQDDEEDGQVVATDPHSIRYWFDSSKITFSPEQLDALLSACWSFENEGRPHLKDHLETPFEIAYSRLIEAFDREPSNAPS